MQTRKRAKSISFGKPKKEEEVKPKEAEVKAVASPAPETPELSATPPADEPKEKEPVIASTPSEPTEAAKKILAIEESEKELSSELSTTPNEEPILSDTPAAPEEKEPEPVVADNFVTDLEPTKPPTEAPKEESNISEPLSLSPEPDNTMSPIIEPEPQSETPEVKNDASPEVGDTPQQSAFSMHEGDDMGDENGSGKKRHFLVYFLVIALFSFILGIGAMAVLSTGILPVSLPKQLPTVSQIGTIGQQPTPTVAPTTAPQPTTAPTAAPVDLEAYSISVLNGSGVRGKAADVRASLTEIGFRVTTTGNAANNEFTTTEISAKQAVSEAYINRLKTELGKEFKVSVASAPAPASQATDVVVTVGSATN